MMSRVKARCQSCNAQICGDEGYYMLYDAYGGWYTAFCSTTCLSDWVKEEMKSFET